MGWRAVLPALLVLAGCAATPPSLRIEGRIEGPAAPAAAADWVVELRDERSGQVLAEQRGRVAQAQPPIPFVLQVDAARIEPGHRRSVRAALRVQGEVRWLSAPLLVQALPPAVVDVGSLRLQPYVWPGGFASALDCGGRLLSVGYLGERLRLIDGSAVHELSAVPGHEPPRFARADDPATFVELDGDAATVVLQGRALPRCAARALP